MEDVTKRSDPLRLSRIERSFRVIERTEMYQRVLDPDITQAERTTPDRLRLVLRLPVTQRVFPPKVGTTL